MPNRSPNRSPTEKHDAPKIKPAFLSVKMPLELFGKIRTNVLEIPHKKINFILACNL